MAMASPFFALKFALLDARLVFSPVFFGCEVRKESTMEIGVLLAVFALVLGTSYLISWLGIGLFLGLAAIIGALSSVLLSLRYWKQQAVMLPGLHPPPRSHKTSRSHHGA
jgi:hypothetical protein